jgi:HlyD family secretion protein
LIMHKRTRTILIGLIIVPAVAAGVYWLVRPAPVLVETAQVVTATFQDTIEEDGRTRVRDRYLISAPLAGQLQRIDLNAGDSVEVGQTLAVLTPAVSPLLDPRVRQELQAQIGSAEAAVDEASSLYENSKVLL